MISCVVVFYRKRWFSKRVVFLLISSLYSPFGILSIVCDSAYAHIDN